MFRFHIPTQTWSSGPSLSSARGWPGLAVLGEFLYVVGGWNMDPYYSSTERLSKKTIVGSDLRDQFGILFYIIC